MRWNLFKVIITSWLTETYSQLLLLEMLTFPCPGTLVPNRTHPRHKFGSMVSTGSKVPIWTMIHRFVEPAVSGEDSVSYTGKEINNSETVSRYFITHNRVLDRWAWWSDPSQCLCFFNQETLGLVQTMTEHTCSASYSFVSLTSYLLFTVSLACYNKNTAVKIAYSSARRHI